MIAVVYKVYPARLSLNTLICFFVSLQSFFLALFFARNLDLWKLEWNMQLLTILCSGSGVVISALVYYLQTWCISNKGPVFAAMFSPLLLIVVGIFSAIAFAEGLHLGSLVGASLIIAGLYWVLWAKRTDNLVIGQPDDEKGFDDDKMQEISINETEMNSVTNETK
ncbi:wat1-related protein [Quercus suber]|uniref:Wat1-related protein n=1 Tax=Quercus suber TaxID=58331 RepID=A0AAW0J2I6_QUESU